MGKREHPVPFSDVVIRYGGEDVTKGLLVQYSLLVEGGGRRVRPPEGGGILFYFGCKGGKA